jgi:calcineurin-like phosphoesterase family protein
MTKEIYITSDLHYGHSNIASQFCSKWQSGYRDFNSLEEMNERILEQLSRIKHNDVLYLLGDVVFGSNYIVSNFLTKLSCIETHLVYGNHDKKVVKNWPFIFKSVQPILNISLNNKKIFMSHYSHRVWEGSHKGVIHLYGHSHGTIPDYGLSMDVGFDTCGYKHEKYTFYTLDEILLIMNKRKIENPDHHH